MKNFQITHLNGIPIKIYDLKGVIQLKEGNYKEAIESFDEALEINPEFALALYNRGIAHRFLGNKKEALSDLNAAIEKSQDVSHIYFARALIKKESNNLDGAIEDYNSSYTEAIYNRAFKFAV